MRPFFPRPFPVQRFHLRAEVTRTLELPEFSGSLLRGAFGQALRGTPLYPIIFEPPSPASEATSRYASVPPPYVIEPPPVGCRRLLVGEYLDFHLILIGPALDYIPVIAAAWASALERPLGHSQGTARLVEVTDELGTVVYDDRALPVNREVPGLIVSPPPAGLSGVTLDFQLPLCLRHKGKNVNTRDLDATQLLRAVVRRVVNVTNLTLGQPFEPDYGILFQNIKTITLHTSLRHVGWERYSSRQNQKMLLAGLAGQCCLNGPLADFWPFLFLGQWLHVGRETTFGLGRYRLTPHFGDTP